MDAVVVVVIDVFAEKASKVVFVQDDHVIEQFSAYAPDPSLGNPILPWTSKERRNTEKGDRREFEQVSHRRRILHGVTGQYETDSSAGFGLSSVVERSSTERKISINPRPTKIENTQAGIGHSELEFLF